MSPKERDSRAVGRPGGICVEAACRQALLVVPIDVGDVERGRVQAQLGIER